jgi:cytoskeletal protein CcmA (bactofilin family)
MSDKKSRRMRDKTHGPATLLSQNCKIVGKISGDGDYQISGQVDGDCEIDGTVSILHDGYWQGTINATAVIIAGTVDGDIFANGQIEIGNTARIKGTITGEAIAVAEGAVVEGEMRTTGKEEPFTFTEKRGL